ncbi:MAG: MarR family transcriptional regulator [bacterium]
MKIEMEIDGRFRNVYHKGLINLIYTANHLHHDFLVTLKKFDLTSQQYNILKVLRGFGKKPRSIEFIRDRMLDKNSDVSRIVNNLYVKKMIERKESLSDRRQKDISITKNGLDLLKKMDNIEKQADKLLSKLSEEEAIQLNRLLDKIRS